MYFFMVSTLCYGCYVRLLYFEDLAFDWLELALVTGSWSETVSRGQTT